MTFLVYFLQENLAVCEHIRTFASSSEEVLKVKVKIVSRIIKKKIIHILF